MAEELSSFNASAVVIGDFAYYVLAGEILWGVTADSYNPEQEMEIHHIIGRGRKADFGDYLGVVGSLTLQILDKDASGGPTAREQRDFLMELKRSELDVLLETPFGDIYNVVTGTISFDRMPGMGSARDFQTAQIPYTEVVAE